MPPSLTNDSNNATDASLPTQATMESLASPSVTMTITERPQVNLPPTLNLTLRPQPRVTWDEDIEDNEGLGRKSSKRCCIFHKERPFGESSTDSSDSDGDSIQSSDGSPSANKPRRIARPKHKKVPDFQRYHA